VIIDSHVYLGESLYGWGVAADELMGRLTAAGVDRAVAVPARPRDYHLGPANDEVAAAQQAYPDFFRGFARVDPNQGVDAVVELERALGELGLRGLFLHPWEELFRVNAPFVDPLLEVARRRGVPVIVATGYPYVSEGLQVADLARRFPDVQIVMTNGGQLNLSGLGQTDAELALEHCANLTLQTAGTYREDFIEGCVARFGADRVLYASSCPLLEPRLEVLRVQWAPNLTDPQREAMLRGNAERLLWR
jgi:predicted TIM-barrel fold metal-dependent hydrolase